MPVIYDRLFAQSSPSLWTSIRFLSLSRLIVSALILLFFLSGELNSFFELPTDRSNFLRASAFYFGIALLFLFFSARFKRFYGLQLLVQVITDLLVLVILIHFAGGLRSGLGVLTVVAVAGGAVLSTRLLAMAFAAAASLLLLIEAGSRAVGADRADGIDISVFFTAGLIGASCFVAAYLVNWLAVRLEREERLAAQRGEDLRRQLAITSLVIAELQQGVLVVGRDGRVQTFNRAASALLGPLSLSSQSLLDPRLAAGWGQVGRVFRTWLGWTSGLARPEAVEISLSVWQNPGQGQTQGLEAKVKLRFLSAQPGPRGGFEPDSVGDDVVLVMEDLRALEERAQQLKLASMGRLSASIAHEIRNPLGAIRHANSLLAEQLDRAPMQRLAGIVETNTVRINQIVEDVLSISRREPPTQEMIDLRSYLPTFLEEFSMNLNCDLKRLNWTAAIDDSLRFDSNHLRQVLVNILGNALRYASMEPAAINIAWARGPGDRIELTIADDGPGLSPEVLQHVFEPFFTTEARGTGLGLYLARELCSANGALLRYELGSEGGRYRGAFVIEAHAEPEASDRKGGQDEQRGMQGRQWRNGGKRAGQTQDEQGRLKVISRT